MLAAMSNDDVTVLLQRWSHGDPQAAEQLAPLVYAQLRRLARRYLRNERPDHTFQSADLVHEAYIRMVDQQSARWQDRAHFFAVSARMMRRILVDYARARHAEKRGGAAPALTLNEAIGAAPRKSVELVALDHALEELAKLDVRQSQIVEMRFFA